MSVFAKALALFRRDHRLFRERLAYELYAVLERGFVGLTRSWLGPVRNPAFRAQYVMTLPQWLYHHHRDTMAGKVSWMGVPLLKNVLDAWIYQEIIHEVQPEVVVEIGSYTGGSTMYLAHLLDIIGKGRVVSVDIERQHFTAVHERILTVTGDSGSDAVVSQVAALCDGKVGMVIHDGDHHKEPVLRDLRLYSRFVSPGSYLIVEDGVMDIFTHGHCLRNHEGPYAAVQEFLRENLAFVVDKARERYCATYNPGGYLKRVIP